MKNIDRLPFPSLMKELLDYSPDTKGILLEPKVRRIYRLCVKRGKTSIANKLIEKYPTILTPVYLNYLKSWTR